MLIVPQNIAAPNAITVVIKSPIFGADLTIASAVVFAVRRYDGSVTTWTGVIKSQTPEEIIAQYVFTGAGEITTTGMYQIQPRLTVPGGTIDSQSIAMMVTSTYASHANLEESAWIAVTSQLPSPGGVSGRWALVTPATSPYTASPFTPWIAVDASASAVTVDLWNASDGDVCVVTDVYASSNAITLVGYTGQLVPVGDGTYASSAALAGLVVKLKYSADLSKWLEW